MQIGACTQTQKYLWLDNQLEIPTKCNVKYSIN